MHKWNIRIMSLKCKVLFPKNALNVFYTGQTVRGYVQLSVEEEQPVSSIEIQISGVAISKLKQNNRTKVHREDCFNHRISILGKSLATVAIFRKFFDLNHQFNNTLNFSWRPLDGSKDTSFPISIQIAVGVASVIRRHIRVHSIQTNGNHSIATSAQWRFHCADHNFEVNHRKSFRIAGMHLLLLHFLAIDHFSSRFWLIVE